MLGLKRGTVRLSPHNSSWKKAFEKERKKLSAGLGNIVVDIQHIGSTSIPDIPAKPILDIGVGVRSVKVFQRIIKPLDKLGYRQAKNKNSPRVHLVFVKGPESKRVCYLHLVKYKGAIWNHDILFRDYLRTHRGRAKQYAELKRKLAKKYKDDRGQYTKGKEKFICDTLKRVEKSLKIDK